ncbi:MAG TPA: diacylglycerol kinase family protein [Phenylobacterium sp.]|nr:diacylglycerol kinase family protein [Phenylobacterium sp.]
MQSPLTDESAVAIRRVHAVVNPASGGVGPGAADELSALFAELGLAHRVSELTSDTSDAMVRAAIDAGPDLVVVLGGDGTARLVAEMCGPHGPLVAPLSGGTMNKLGRALYGSTPWREALIGALEGRQLRWIPGGEVGGRAFFCGALIGSPALMARAREAIRAHELGRAWRRAVVASRKTFQSRLSYELQGDVGRGVAISFICPTVSRAPGEGGAALRAAVLDPPEGEVSGAAAVRWALRHLIGDWRHNPDASMPCLSGRAWARTAIPIMLDGEFFRLGREVEVRFRPRAFRALAPSADEGAGSGFRRATCG